MLRTNPALTLIGGLLLLPSINASATSYSFQTLNNNNDPTFNQLLGINNTGEIAGYFGSGALGHPNQGYTLNPPYGQANYTNENFPGSVQTQVTGINNNGVTVGFGSNQNTVSQVNNNFGFVDVNGVFTIVNSPLVAVFNGVTVNQLLAVNNNGIAAGFYVDANGNDNGYTYNIGTKSFTNLTISGAVSDTAAGINNAGEIAGFFTNGANTTEGFILNGNIQTNVQDPFGTSTMILGLNNTGLADGVYMDANGVNHGFIYNINTGQFTTVDDPNANQVSGSGTTLNGLNDRGQLTGFYVDANGNTDGLLAAVIPEPSPLAMFGSGLLSLIGLSRRRNPF